MAKAAAKGPARNAGYWRERLEAMRGELVKATARVDGLTAEHGAVALDAHIGDAVAMKRLDRLTADLGAADRERTALEGVVASALGRLGEAEDAEVAAAREARRARREALLIARVEIARQAERLIDSLGEALAELRAQAEEIMALTAGRDMAETLKPIKTDHRLQLAMSRAGFTWRDRQGAAHPLFPDSAGFAEAEIAAQAAYAAKDVR